MERIDDLQFEGLRLIQDDDLFCFGCDAVELANFVDTYERDTVCDLGCGNGIIGVLVAKKRGSSVVGIEIQIEAALLAERNAALNNLSGKISVLNMRIQDIKGVLEKGSMNAVVSNPPYRKKESGFQQESAAIAIARHELEITLQEIVEAAAYLTSTRGAFYTVGQTQRLAETMALCSMHKLEPKILQILRPADSKRPHLFLLKCLKDGKTGLTVLSERNVFGQTGKV